MRPLVLSLGVCTCVLSIAWAQSSNDAGPSQTVPVGQTFKNFEFPFYENGKLKWTATATQATGITQNRAEAFDIKIKVYDDDVVSTTITSPQADIYVSERKMRSSHTVQIERSDMEATAQTCDFDMGSKKYVLRNNVKVTLRNFDAGQSISTAPGATPATSQDGGKTPEGSTQAESPMTPRALLNNDSLPELPGSATSTNSAPMPPTSPDSK